MTRTLVRVGALLALVASAALVVFALDVLSWSRQLTEQDMRFVAAPRQARFSQPTSLLPFGLTERALSADDDLPFRRQLQSFTRVQAGAVADSQQFEQLRGETQLALAGLSRVDRDSGRRSRAANMTGVLAFDAQLLPTAQDEVAKLVEGVTDAFRSAVEIDPTNADAKLNLELALRLPRAASLPGNAPSGTREVGKLAGLGEPGSGY
jgi:hypothetical protein